jgi:hypothetical protein
MMRSKAAVSISKTAQVLRYFAQRYYADAKSGIKRVRLVKMAYMSDVIGREYLGAAITDFQWYRYLHGPYDDAVVAAVAELVAADLGLEKKEYDEGGVIKRLLPVGGPVTFEFDDGELEVLKYVGDNYLGMPMGELIEDVVYRTAPMRELLDADPEQRRRLDMKQLDDAGTRQAGFKLTDVLRAERAALAGRVVTEF